MARKAIPPRAGRVRSREDESLLLRSAQSLGRMIGALQRQLDIATGRLEGSKANGSIARKRVAPKRGAKAKGGTTSRGVARTKSAAATSAARRSAKKR